MTDTAPNQSDQEKMVEDMYRMALYDHLEKHTYSSKEALETAREEYLKYHKDIPTDSEIYQKAIDKDPHDVVSLIALGTLYQRTGNWFSALEHYENATEILGQQKKTAAIHIKIADIHETYLLDMKNATIHFKHALALDPSLDAAQKGIERMNLHLTQTVRLSRHKYKYSPTMVMAYISIALFFVLFLVYFIWLF